MNSIFIFLVIFLSYQAFAQTSYVVPTRILMKKGYQLSIGGDYFKSRSKLDEDGGTLSYTEDESFQRIQGEVAGLYGLTENLQIGGRVRFRQNSSTNAMGTENSNGVESTYVNLIYAFKPIGQYHYSLEGGFGLRPFNNEEGSVGNEGKLIIGDDGNDTYIGAGLTYATKTNNFFTIRGGYRDPGKNISDEFYWDVQGAIAWSYVALVAGAQGVSSLKNDPYRNNFQDKPSYYTGATNLYNGRNREWFAPYAGLNLAMGKTWRIELTGSQVISGKSTDLGTSYSFNLVKRVEDKKSNRADQVFKEYDFEASITKISPKKGYVVIDKGLSDDVRKGMKIDFFEFDYVGGNILVARGVVYDSKSDSAIVKISHIFNTQKSLRVGNVARGSFK